MELICKMVKKIPNLKNFYKIVNNIFAPDFAILVFSEVLFQTGSQLTYRQRKFEISSDARQMLESMLR